MMLCNISLVRSAQRRSVFSVALDGKSVLHSEPANVGLGKDEAVKPNASDTPDVLLGGRACLDILNINLAHMTEGTLHERWRKTRHAICVPHAK